MKGPIMIFAAAFLALSCSPDPPQLSRESGGPSTVPGTSVRKEAEPDFTNAYVDPIVGLVPLTDEPLPKNLVVWIRCGREFREISPFIEAARQSVKAKEGLVFDSSVLVDTTFDPENPESFAQIVFGSGVGTLHWIVTLNTNAEVTDYKRTVSRSGPPQ